MTLLIFSDAPTAIMYARALAVVADGLWRHAQDGANVCVAEARFQRKR